MRDFLVAMVFLILASVAWHLGYPVTSIFWVGVAVKIINVAPLT
jgi:hypothetical protein